jgi:hypothetical protein
LILGAEPGLRIRRWPSRAARCSLSHPACFRGLRLRLAVAARRRLMAMHRRWRDFLNRPSRTGSRSRRGALAGAGGDADDGGGRPDDCRMKGDGIDGDDRALQSILFRPPAAVRRDGRALVGLAFDGRLTEPAAARGGEDQNEGGGRAEPAPWRWLAYGAKRFHREVLPSIATNSGRSG